MKKKEPEATPEQPLKIGDKVFTSISLRPGEVIRAEEKKGEYRSYNGCEEYRELTVSVPMPMLDQPYFIKVTLVCRESELKRAR